MAAFSQSCFMWQLGSDGVGDTPENFAAFVRAELAKYRQLIQKAGIKIE